MKEADAVTPWKGGEARDTRTRLPSLVSVRVVLWTRRNQWAEAIFELIENV